MPNRYVCADLLALLPRLCKSAGSRLAKPCWWSAVGSTFPSGVTIFSVAKPSQIFYDWFVKTITLSGNSLRRYGLLLVPLLLACFAPSARAQADRNTATGRHALSSNTTGDRNTATGVDALENNTTGDKNTAIGNLALLSNTTGDRNTAFGHLAGWTLTTGHNNINIGDHVSGVAGESYTTRIGAGQTRTFIDGISGTAVSGSAVVVNANGQLGVTASSRRFKEEIKPMEGTSEALFALKPVTFRYKPEIESTRPTGFGLVAEDVDKINPDLVIRDREGRPYSVRYDQVNAMLLNEFLKEHRKVEDQERRLDQQETTLAQQQKEFVSTIARQQKQIETLTAGLQKVSAQLATASPSRGGLEASKPAPHVVMNDQ